MQIFWILQRCDEPIIDVFYFPSIIQIKYKHKKFAINGFTITDIPFLFTNNPLNSVTLIFFYVFLLVHKSIFSFKRTNESFIIVINSWLHILHAILPDMVPHH